MIGWIILAAAVCLFLLLEMRKPKNFPPGPVRLPLVGYVPQLYMKAHLVHKHLRDLSERHGPIVGLFMARRPYVIVNSYEAIKEVLLNDDFNGRPSGHVITTRTWNKKLGVLFTSGELWEKQRQFTLHQFRNLGFGKQRHEDVIVGDVDEMVQEIKRIREPFNIQKLLGVSAINVLWTIMEGKKFSRSDPRLQTLVYNINKLFHSGRPYGALAIQFPLLRPLLAELSGVNSVLRGFIAVRDSIMKSVLDHKKTMLRGEVRGFFDAYLQEMEDTGDATFSEEQLTALSMDMLAAGVETSTSLVSFCIFYICLHPSVQLRAQEELDRVVGRDRYPTMEDRKNLVYLDSVYTEVFRSRCPTPTTAPHVALRDTTIQGYHIPKGTAVLPNLYAVFNEASYWRDPGIFRPARFLDGDGKLKSDDHFFPFGKGKRACLGENLAMMTTFLTFASLLQRLSFNFDPSMLLMDTEGSSGFTLRPPQFKVIASARF